MGRKTRIYGRANRLRKFLALVMARYKMACYFCKEQLAAEAVLPKRKVDELTIHHINGDHSDNCIENRTLAHRKCHKAWHMKNSWANGKFA